MLEYLKKKERKNTSVVPSGKKKYVVEDTKDIRKNTSVVPSGKKKYVVEDTKDISY